MGKIIYFTLKSNNFENEKNINLENLYKELRNSTLEVIKCTGKVPKLDISQLSEKEKEIFYIKAMKILEKDYNYIRLLLE